MSRWPGAGNSVESWEKEPGSPVCEADLMVDAFLKRELSQLLPAAGWLSEEAADNAERLRKGLIWLVDPIDGTRDYLRGRSGWAVSVALISAGRPLIGLLEAPAREERWEAEAGQGALRNGEKLAASTREKLAGARIPADSLAKADRILAPVEKLNSIALRVAMVAAGQADILATLRWGFEWDIAAATLIAREAGAEVSDAFGNRFSYNKPVPRAFGLLVSAPRIHAAAIAHFAERAASLSAKVPD